MAKEKKPITVTMEDGSSLDLLLLNNYAHGVGQKEALTLKGKASNSVIDQVLMGGQSRLIETALPCITGTFYAYNTADQPFGEVLYIPSDDLLLVVHIPPQIKDIKNALLVSMTDFDHEVTIRPGSGRDELKRFYDQGLIGGKLISGLMSLDKNTIADVEFTGPFYVMPQWGKINGLNCKKDNDTYIGTGPSFSERGASDLGLANFRQNVTGLGSSGPMVPGGGLIVRGTPGLAKIVESYGKPKSDRPQSISSPTPPRTRLQLRQEQDALDEKARAEQRKTILNHPGYSVNRSVYMVPLGDATFGVLATELPTSGSSMRFGFD